MVVSSYIIVFYYFFVGFPVYGVICCYLWSFYCVSGRLNRRPVLYYMLDTVQASTPPIRSSRGYEGTHGFSSTQCLAKNDIDILDTCPMILIGGLSVSVVLGPVYTD